MDELLVECSIHLDGVPLKDVRTFKCGHGFCTTCIEALFSHPAPYTCPTCRKRIQRKDGLQIFLHPHRSLTQYGIQVAHKTSDIDIEPDDADSTEERVHIGMHKYARMVQRVERLQQQISAVNLELGMLQDRYRTARSELDVLEVQNDALKSRCTDLESQREDVLRMNDDLRRKYDAANNSVQKWRESCKKAQADALTVRKEKESQDNAMVELMEREKMFRHRTHVNKVAYDKYKRKCDALRQKLENLQRTQRVTEDPEDQSLLVVDRDAPDKLEHAADEDWLDEVCEVRGDRLDVDSDDTDDSGKENIYEVQPGLTRRATESVDDRDRPIPEDRPLPTRHFTSEWNLERETTGHKGLNEKKKRKTQEDAVMGAPPGKLLKVSLTRGKARDSEERDSTRLHYPSSSKQMLGRSSSAGRAPVPTFKFPPPLDIDSSGHVKGAVRLGSRRRMDKSS